MAAYAALLSLMHTINNIHNHPQPPISLHPKHLLSLTQNLHFLQDYLERYSTEEDEDLERRITAAAHAAEDVIESHIVDLIEARSTNHNISSVDFYGDLERAIQVFDLIKGEAMEISEAKNKGSQHHYQLHTNSSATHAASTWQSNSSMVVIDDALVSEVLDKVVGQQSNLQVIPIVGMGGIGKTTFARNIYSKPLIDILAWVVISQECSGSKILSQVLGQEKNGDDDELDKLGLPVYQRLWGRRYLIVMDDIWTSEPWEKVKLFFPDNNNGSRIMITTRNSHLAFELSGSHGFHMNFLDEDKSWDLLCGTVFGKKSNCPEELEKMGKTIARKCRGLPLSVVVIGGLLRKSMTMVYWENTLKNMNSLINLEDDKYCLQLLLTSYKELSVHLKPCFLYMGIFPEDTTIKVSDVIKIWVAEGIVKPIDKRSLEEAAEGYLRELTERNLIIVEELKWNGKLKTCKIHDLLRDVCVREAKRQRFYCVVKEEDKILEGERRICLLMGEEYLLKVLAALKSASLARSLFFIDGGISMDDIEELVSNRMLRFGYKFGCWWGDGFLKVKSDAAALPRIN